MAAMIHSLIIIEKIKNLVLVVYLYALLEKGMVIDICNVITIDDFLQYVYEITGIYVHISFTLLRIPRF